MFPNIELKTPANPFSTFSAPLNTDLKISSTFPNTSGILFIAVINTSPIVFTNGFIASPAALNISGNLSIAAINTLPMIIEIDEPLAIDRTIYIQKNKTL
jgi:hypothetical protein